MSIQGRLLRRKKWYTLDDAARRLTVELGEPATVRDVLQLALDGEIRICVILHGQAAKTITDVHGKIDSPLFFTFEGEDMEPAPVVTHGNPITVDEDSLKFLEGTFEMSDASGSLGRMLKLKITGAFDEFKGGFWSVKDIGNEEAEWLIFSMSDDAPSNQWPDDSSLMVLRNDLDTFISSLDEPPSGQHAEGEELRALEALGLLADTFAKQAHRYQRNGRPNCSQIAQAMSNQAGTVYGMGESKLAHLLSDALAAWEEKRR